MSLEKIADGITYVPRKGMDIGRDLGNSKTVQETLNDKFPTAGKVIGAVGGTILQATAAGMLLGSIGYQAVLYGTIAAGVYQAVKK
jgi:hypothetical protein